MSYRRASRQMVIARAEFLGIDVPSRLTKKKRAEINRAFRKEVYTKKASIKEIRAGRAYVKAPIQTLPITQALKEQYRYLGDVSIKVGRRGVVLAEKSVVTISGTYENTKEAAMSAWLRSVGRIAAKESVMEIRPVGDIDTYLVRRFVSE